jgi:hypothetical protein
MSDHIKYNGQKYDGTVGSNAFGAMMTEVMPNALQSTIDVNWAIRIAQMSGRVHGIGLFGSMYRGKAHTSPDYRGIGTTIVFPTNYFSNIPFIKVNCQLPKNILGNDNVKDMDIWADTEQSWTYLGVRTKNITKDGFDIEVWKSQNYLEWGALCPKGVPVYGYPGQDWINISWHAFGI